MTFPLWVTAIDGFALTSPKYEDHDEALDAYRTNTASYAATQETLF